MCKKGSASSLAPITTISIYFGDLPDPRVDRCKRHKLLDIVTIAICAVISNADGWTDIEAYGRAKEAWRGQFLELPAGIPSHDTFARVFAKLDPSAFQTCFLRWIGAIREKLPGDVIALDGKTSRRTRDSAIDLSPLHIVSAWSSANHLVLGQMRVDKKSNEITAIPLLLNMLDIKGCLVTIDALGCQTAIADQIISVACVRSERITATQTTSETRFYISSAPSNAERLATAIRSHWGIENQVHWVLDVVFADGDSRVRIDHSAHNLAIIRQIVLNMLRQEISLKTSLRQKRLRAGWDDTYALKVLQVDLEGVEQI